eukprot:TRINITY_DN9473_c0_g4_i1.p1 TRINITY_DN9473_c0_g4~~TRINITY_DN9473_c0_g4_i1.p1  ORF type:complete len:107 (-),score=18.65 TRINITY_DN9473_c0_g4_i1:663-983(-)
MTMQVIFDKVNKIYFAGDYLTGFVRLRGVEGRAHGDITGRIYGGIKFGRKSKDPNAKDRGFSYLSTLDTVATIAKEGTLFGFLSNFVGKTEAMIFRLSCRFPRMIR